METQELINILLAAITIIGLLIGIGFGVYKLVRKIVKGRKEFRFTFAHATILASLVLYILSLTQDAITYYGAENKEVALGSIMILCMGATAILGGALPEWIIWLANPLYVAAIIMLFTNNRKSSLVILTAVLLALIFLSWQHILISTEGAPEVIAEKKLGYVLWLLSFVTLFIGSLIHFNRASSQFPKDSKEQL